MNAWIIANAGATVGILIGIAVLALVLLILWLAGVRNIRLLSLELNAADREITRLDSSIAEQAARLRIVRELNEVAVDSVSAIIRLADSARYIVESDPTVMARTASQIATSGRSTLAGLRRIVSVAGTGESAPRPSISSLDDLLGSMRTQGLTITFSETGERFDLQPGADVALYRILEEAVSNALSYGGPGTDVRVSFTWTAEGVQLLVDDDGIQSDGRRRGLDPGDITQQRRYSFQDDLNTLTGEVTGEGIAEMRERAVAFGGIFNSYPVPGVGFSVSAIFPALRFDNGVHGVNLNR
ncbi:MAG: ATP-binding protein [Burkholderiaceae bacterium]|nr:ATP-binding protein [Microbacteriaceae bacterium]